MRFILALKCFFLVLFARRLPAEAADLLPAEARPALPPPEAQIVSGNAEAPAAAVEVREKIVEKLVERDSVEQLARGAVLLLSLLQREGRLLDFLEEDIDGYSDDQIGAAVRDIHRGCKKALAEHLQVEPLMKEPDNASVRVEPGFDASRIRLVGNVVGQPPFTGTLRHPGWRGAKVTLPQLPDHSDPMVIAPAEVEL